MAALLTARPAEDRASSEARFSAIYMKQYRPVLAYCMRRSPGEADASDAAAEVFAIAWRRLVDLPEEPLPWLYGIARRVLANQRRGDERRGALYERLQGLEEPSATQNEPLESPASAAFARLSDDDRELLALAAWEELTPREISSVLGVAVPVISVRLHRAKKRLRTLLEADARAAKDPVPSRIRILGESE